MDIQVKVSKFFIKTGNNMEEIYIVNDIAIQECTPGEYFKKVNLKMYRLNISLSIMHMYFRYCRTL